MSDDTTNGGHYSRGGFIPGYPPESYDGIVIRVNPRDIIRASEIKAWAKNYLGKINSSPDLDYLWDQRD